MDLQTRAVLDELVGREAPPFEALAARDAEWLAALHSAWVQGRIPGFPEEAELAVAREWLLSAYAQDEARLRAELASRRATG